MRRLPFPVVILLTILIAIPAAAQPSVPGRAVGATADPAQPGAAAQAESGRLVGTVTAPDGARLPGVTVTVTDVETGRSLVVVTAGNGSYGGSGLLPGTYEIRAELTGFQAQVSPRITVSAGETKEVDLSLPLSTVSEAVTVVGALVKDSIETTAIRDSSARDIGEALSRVNGMSLVRKGAIANDVALQGFQSRNLTVLVDGNRLYGACPNGMDPAVFHADFAEVDHLEIGKGPFDVRNQGSLGGLVNVVTRTPGRGLHASPSLSVGSWGYVNPSATASFGTDRVSALAGYSYRTSNPYRDGSGALFTEYANYRKETVASTAFDVQTAWGKVLLAPADSHSVQVAYTRQWADHVLYPYLLMDGITDDADRASASYAFAPADAFVRTVSARAYYSRVRHWMTDALRVSSANMPREYSMGTQADSSATGGRVDVGIGDVTTGVELFRREWDATTMMAGSKYAPQYAIPFVTLDNVGAFVEYERPFGSRTTMAAGGRVDWAHSEADAAKANTDLYFAYKGTRSVSASDTGVSGKVRLVRRLGEGFELSGGVGHAYRVPDPQERYFGLKRMGNDWVGNPDLRPTANTGVQAGVSYRYRRLLASLAVSGNWLSDYITVHSQQKVNPVPGIMNTTARSYANVDAQMTSAEFSLSLPLTDRWSATATASYIRGTKSTDPAKNITSANIAEIPPAYGTVGLRYDRASFFAEAQGVFSADQTHVDTDLQETPTPGYGLLNLRAGGEVKGLRITLALDNVFDRLYLNYLSFQRDPYRIGTRVREPGRNLYTNVAYRF
jgi:iron complex outermembrane recepter protein